MTCICVECTHPIERSNAHLMMASAHGLEIQTDQRLKAESRQCQDSHNQIKTSSSLRSVLSTASWVNLNPLILLWM